MSAQGSTWVVDERLESAMAGAPSTGRDEFVPDGAALAELEADTARFVRRWFADAPPYVPPTPWGPGHPDFKEPPS